MDMSAVLRIPSSYCFTLKKPPKACISQAKNQDDSLKIRTRKELVLSDYYKCKTPLVNALKASAEEDAASFHFPGHNRGQAPPSTLTNLIGIQTFKHDLPELPELDNLFAPKGPILEAQKYAAELFGASETWFLVNGTTCGIHAAIMSTCYPGDVLILPRNAHFSAISAMVLSGVVPKYIVPYYDSKWDISTGFTPLQLKEAIEDLEIKGKKPAAVLVVSPSYHGICSDILEISNICHGYKIPLIVDEAHGSHFGFHSLLPNSALSQGADIVVQSSHKTLCSLTQSSMLHISGYLINRERICRSLQILQTSSPSYLLLASLDATRAQLTDSTIFNEVMQLADEAKSMISKIPRIPLINITDFRTIDPLRITIGTWQLGISGFAADDILYREFGVVSELIGTRSFTLALTLGTQKEHVLRLVTGLKKLSETFYDDSSTKYASKIRVFDDFEVGLSPREAFFAEKKRVSLEECIGEICGEIICCYPPGIPLLIPGEVITEDSLKYLLFVKSITNCVVGASDPEVSSLVVCRR